MKTTPIAAALAVSVALTGGCATYKESRIYAKVGTYTMLTGIPITIGAIVLGNAQDTMTDQMNVGLGGLAIAVGVFGIGALLGGSGLIGMGIYDDPAETQRREAKAKAAEDAVVRQRTVDGWVMARSAAAAARAGDCELVRKLDRQVIVLDGKFHTKVFLADVWIKRCLAP